MAEVLTESPKKKSLEKNRMRVEDLEKWQGV